MKKKILIININNHFDELRKKIKNKKIFFIKKKKDLTFNKVAKINPDLIFIPHWHWKISDDIISRFVCVGFHSAPLPIGRGGSPIQNLIIRGFRSTQVCSFRMNNKFDAGDVYLRTPLSLAGTGTIIFEKLYKIIKKQIIQLSKKLPKPKPQRGKPVFYKRRKPEQSEIDFSNKIIRIYDQIRMLDVNFKNFPKSFISKGKYKIQLDSAKLSKDKEAIHGNFKISKP